MVIQHLFLWQYVYHRPKHQRLFLVLRKMNLHECWLLPSCPVQYNNKIRNLPLKMFSTFAIDWRRAGGGRRYVGADEPAIELRRTGTILRRRRRINRSNCQLRWIRTCAVKSLSVSPATMALVIDRVTENIQKKRVKVEKI